MNQKVPLTNAADPFSLVENETLYVTPLCRLMLITTPYWFSITCLHPKMCGQCTSEAIPTVLPADPCTLIDTSIGGFSDLKYWRRKMKSPLVCWLNDIENGYKERLMLTSITCSFQLPRKNNPRLAWQCGRVAETPCYEFIRSNLAGSNRAIVGAFHDKTTANSGAYPLLGW